MYTYWTFSLFLVADSDITMVRNIYISMPEKETIKFTIKQMK